MQCYISNLGGGLGLECAGTVVTPSLRAPDQSPPHRTSTLYIAPTTSRLCSNAAYIYTLYFSKIDMIQKYVCLGEDHSIAEAVHIPGDREAVLVDRDAGAHVLRVEPQQILLLLIFLAAFIFISNLNCCAVLRFAKCKYFLNLRRLGIFNVCYLSLMDSILSLSTFSSYPHPSYIVS